MVMFLIDSMRHKEVVLLVSLHPRTRNQDVRMIDWSDRIVNVDLPIEKIVSHCDIFVASCSATIRYALAMRKPVINFDIYGLGYTEYDDFSMVLRVDSPEQFQKSYNKLIENKSYVQSLMSYYSGYEEDYFTGGELRLSEELKCIIQPCMKK